MDTCLTFFLYINSIQYIFQIEKNGVLLLELSSIDAHFAEEYF